MDGGDGEVELLGDFGSGEAFEEFCGDMELCGVGERFEELFVELLEEGEWVGVSAGEVIE
jgi:hypothetical protein